MRGLQVGTRYKLADKTRRNDALRDYAAAHPSVKLRELAAMFGVGIARVWAILHANGQKPTE